MRLPREENFRDEQVAYNMLIIVCVCVCSFVCMKGHSLLSLWCEIEKHHHRQIQKKIVCEERAKDQMAIFAFAEDWSDKIVSSHCNI